VDKVEPLGQREGEDQTRKKREVEKGGVQKSTRGHAHVSYQRLLSCRKREGAIEGGMPLCLHHGLL
jgi:hypothetical protein